MAGKKKGNVVSRKEKEEMNKELAAFNSAKALRQPILDGLKKCKTADKLESILFELEKNRNNKNYPIKKTMTDAHKEEIQELEEEINNWVEKREVDFPAEVEDTVTELDTEDETEELDTEDETEELDTVDETEELDTVDETEELATEVEVAQQQDLENEKPKSDEMPSPMLCKLAPQQMPSPMLCKLKPQQNPIQPELVQTNDGTGIEGPKINLNPVVPQSEPKAQVIAEREAHLANVKIKLQKLSDKRAEFTGKLTELKKIEPYDHKKADEYTKAISALASIHTQVQSLYHQYVTGKIELEAFKAHAKPFFNDENENVQALQSHRGIKQILINLLAAILSVGVIYGIAALVKGSFLVFKPHTDSSQKAQDLSKEIENAAAPAA